MSMHLIEQVLVLAGNGTAPRRLDVLIDGDKFSAIGPRLDAPQGVPIARTNGRGKLLVAGLVNAHHHSHDRFDKGRFSGMPLEIWLSLYNPPQYKRCWTPREVYLRTLLNGIEMLRGGITTIVDDIHFGNILDQELVEAALHAYQDLGIRAEVSAAWSDKPFYECVPYLKDCLPEELWPSPHEPPITVKAVEAFWRSLATAWDGRVRFVFSPSAPHRCTPQFLEMTWTLAESFQRPVLVHVLETRIQALTAHRLYQMPMAKFMHQRGYMTNNTIIAHGVWLSDEELELVAESGASVIHNPACNLKQGSGVAPITAMIRKGVNVGLGTDNNNGNDTNSMFDAMRLATFTGTAGLSEPSYPIDSECALHMATRAGARALGRETEIGSIEIGKQADFSLLDLSTSAFFPMNDAMNQFVFCEQGQSVKDVFVAGRHLIQDGHLIQLDEADLMEEIAQRMPAMMRKIERGRPFAERLRPFLLEAYERCVDDPWMKPWLHAHNSLGLPPGSAPDGIRKV